MEMARNHVQHSALKGMGQTMKRHWKDACRHRLSWRVVNVLWVVALLLGTVQPVVTAQGCEGGACLPTVSDVARLTSIVQVSSSRIPAGSVRAVQIEWTTGYESFNAGFNILEPVVDGFRQVNDALIPSQVSDSLEPQRYSYAAILAGDRFYLEHVTLEGESHRAGPFIVGETVGEVAEPVAVDWQAIRVEHDAQAQAQETVRVAEINAALDAVRGPTPSPDEPLVEQSDGVLGDWTIFLPLIAGGDDGVQSAEANVVDVAPDAVIEFHVDQDGIYRVTHDDLLAQGFDLTGVPSAYLALTNRGVPIRMRVVAARNWGPGAFLEFVGEALDTLYTDTNVYLLKVDRSKAFRTFRNLRAPDLSQSAPGYYREKMRFEQNVGYAMFGVNDPWYWGYDFAQAGKPKSATYTVGGVDAIASGGPPATMISEVWGYTTGKHHVVIAMNGSQVQDLEFTGAIGFVGSSQLPSGVLVNGDNSLTWTLPGDRGEKYDAVGFEAFEVEYSRRFVAREGRLIFEHDAALLQIDGLPSPDVVVYSDYRNRMWRIDRVQATSSASGYRITFPGWGAGARYLVAVAGAPGTGTPDIKAGRAPVDVTSGQIDFVIVTHPDFLAGVQPLVAQRTGEGYRVKVVNVEDVYAQFGFGIFDAEAIHDYLKHAIGKMGARYVLLVGGDTRDYRGYSSQTSVSFIPSLYALTYARLNYAPVDPLYTDVDGDAMPDAAIGRWPVRTTQELAAVVQKTLAYSSQGRTALFAADKNDGQSYSAYSDGFAAELPPSWRIERAYLDFDTVTVAKQKLKDAINRGVGLVTYLGHSNPDRWTFSGLFHVNDVSGLTNTGKPTIAVQYSCWNSYYVIPQMRSLSESLLIAEDRGAAAVFGATGLTGVHSDVALGMEMALRLAATGKTIGDAEREAKEQLAAYDNSADVVLGWTLFGDPTLKIEP